MIYWYPCVPHRTLFRSTTTHFLDICYISFPIGHCTKCQSFWKKKWDWNCEIPILSKFYENYHGEDVENVWFNINQKLWEGLRFEIVTPIGLHINEYFNPLKSEIWIANSPKVRKITLNATRSEKPNIWPHSSHESQISPCFALP